MSWPEKGQAKRGFAAMKPRERGCRRATEERIVKDSPRAHPGVAVGVLVARGGLETRKPVACPGAPGWLGKIARGSEKIAMPSTVRRDGSDCMHRRTVGPHDGPYKNRRCLELPVLIARRA